VKVIKNDGTHNSFVLKKQANDFDFFIRRGDDDIAEDISV
jgi:hypothetical protein